MYELLKPDPTSAARLGRLTTSRGVIQTPEYMPVGTQATVKAVTNRDLEEMETQIILGNTYHLYLRPGLDDIRHHGGLHRFMNWQGPILTDSGGFQVFSLAKLRQITDEGVVFRSHLDGSKLFLGPRESITAQRVLGSDIMMIFDECPPWPAPEADVRRAVERTLRWAADSKQTHQELEASSASAPTPRQALFGIVQGGDYPHLRRECAERLVEIGFDGYAIGGVSVGEPEAEMYKAAEATCPCLPPDRVRYCMGLGQPNQLVELVARGVDIFDCVLPTRAARHGTAYTWEGTVNVRGASLRRDERPLVEGCPCPACCRHTRAYLRHLFKAGEILGLMLLSLHNLRFFLDLMARIRRALADGSFAAFRQEFHQRYQPSNRTER